MRPLKKERSFHSVHPPEERVVLPKAPFVVTSFHIQRDEDFLCAYRADVAPIVLQHLRSKSLRVDRRIDLHGMTTLEVSKQLPNWIRAAHREGARFLCIIHGKGLHSQSLPLLRDCVWELLQSRSMAPIVLAFATAPPHLGGSGATVVAISKPTPSR
ncbi:MAG: Smr/MutS family protein [Sandaracinaceae bacterium]|nr:Smr/MutS family protein [Sandaracinaceae bacterium]MDW8245192.1 Smr/MutS family protein [Sandaracinaceae bacterium]